MEKPEIRQTIEDHEESRAWMGFVILFIGFVAFVVYSAYTFPTVFLVAMVFTGLGMTVVGISLRLAYGQKPLFEYTAQLATDYPGGVLYLNGVAIKERRDLVLIGFRRDDRAANIEDYGPYVVFDVRRQNFVFWKNVKSQREEDNEMV